jgi:hypothetical protein
VPGVSVLTAHLRKELQRACVRGRREAEAASRAAIGTLGVLDETPPAHLSEADRDLRRALRAKRDQLGDLAGQVELLVADCAYEQWHRLLFARFLAESNLLIHPQFNAPVTLAECGELAADLGEPDAWAVAGRFASEILPGIFRLDDPCVRIRLASEGRLALEQIVESIAVETFAADDALGWVYQHWQKERKDEVNTAERKIGGADLAPVTQLFTENYMVRFLLQNSLGAWWASRYPDSPLLAGWEFLRYDDDGTPAAGTFGSWPSVVGEVTVVDPCCGSGHFLVEAFDMLWQMRAEEEGLAPIAAQDAVLRANLFGLELDPRCVQIAMFAVAVAAWKAGGGWRELPPPQIACSGIPVRATVEQWNALAAGDDRLSQALSRLHVLFRDADTLGSLIAPRRVVEGTVASGRQQSLDDIDWVTIQPLLQEATREEHLDPAARVLGTDAAGVARAADYLSRTYTLVCTNVPYLGRTGQGTQLREHLTVSYPAAAEDLATAFTCRLIELSGVQGSVATVLPESALFLGNLTEFRRELMRQHTLRLVTLLGPGAFIAIGGEVVRVALVLLASDVPSPDARLRMADISTESYDQKSLLLRSAPLTSVSQGSLLQSPNSRIMPGATSGEALLSQFATSTEGTSTGDGARYVRAFWELPRLDSRWVVFQAAPETTTLYGGLEWVMLWEGGDGTLASDPGARVQGLSAWGGPGVLVERMSSLRASLYMGEAFQKSTVVVRPADPTLLAAIWHFCQSGTHKARVLAFERRIGIATSSIVSVDFDADHWRKVAEAAGPLPEPFSDNPTQSIFDGWPKRAVGSLQVAVARLLGYRWPGQPDIDELDPFADEDGIICLPSVLGERTAADRLQEVLARAFDGTWSASRAAELLTASGSKKTDVDTWLRDEFFKAHTQIFKNRPFVWHIWDGRKDGFGALVNYHRLDRPTLERLAYTYLGDWIERQVAGAREGAAGAEERLIAARELQRKLALILAGQPPYDIYVRWKQIAAQPVGWEPDLDDGVRLNIRPFVQAGVLRAKFNVKWEKDRGKNPDGSERLNDLHLTVAEKQAASDPGRVV